MSRWSFVMIAACILLIAVQLTDSEKVRKRRDATEVWEKFKGKVNDGVKAIKDAIPDNVKTGFRNAGDTISDAAKKVGDGATDLYNKAKDKIGK